LKRVDTIADSLGAPYALPYSSAFAAASSMNRQGVRRRPLPCDVLQSATQLVAEPPPRGHAAILDR